MQGLLSLLQGKIYIPTGIPDIAKDVMTYPHEEMWPN